MRQLYQALVSMGKGHTNKPPWVALKRARRWRRGIFLNLRASEVPFAISLLNDAKKQVTNRSWRSDYCKLQDEMSYAIGTHADEDIFAKSEPKPEENGDYYKNITMVFAGGGFWKEDTLVGRQIALMMPDENHFATYYRIELELINGERCWFNSTDLELASPLEALASASE